MDFELSQHFRERWAERVGGRADLDVVKRIIDESEKVQPCRDLFKKDGKPFRMLAMYVNYDRRLAIKLDPINQVAVTVMSREFLSSRRKGDH